MTSIIVVEDYNKAVRERHLKHIAEITENLASPQSEELNYEQQQWLERRMRSQMGVPWKSWSTRGAQIV